MTEQTNQNGQDNKGAPGSVVVRAAADYALPGYRIPFPLKSPAWFELDVPAATAEETPLELTVQVPFEHISRLQVLIPPGHQGLARLSIEIAGGRLIPGPTSNVRWLRGDSYTFDSPIDYSLEGPPYQLFFRGWNEDSLKNHTFFISVYP